MAGRKGNKFQARFRTKEKYWRPTFDTMEEAELWEKRAKVAHLRGEPIPDPKTFGESNSPTFKVYLDNNVDKIWMDKSPDYAALMRTYCYDAAKFFGYDRLMRDIMSNDFDDLIEYFRDNRSLNDKTINKRSTAVRMVFKRAEKRGVLKKCPIIPHLQEGAGRTRYLSDKEEIAMFKYFESCEMPEVFHRACFMIDTGARDGEVVKLRWDHIDNGSVTFWNTKNKLKRTIPLTERAKSALEWSKREGNDKPFPMAYRTFLEAWRRMRFRLGLEADEAFVPYAMRHTCATRLVKRSIDPYRVKKWMGHKRLETTLGYTHLDDADLFDCVSVLQGDAAS